MTLQDAERLLGVNITLHDLSGVFNVPGGSTLLGPNRQSHRRYAVCNLGYCAACQAYCRDQIRRRCLSRQQPFVSSCWKGVREVVVPLIRHDILLAVLFVGSWRSATPSDAGATARWRSEHARLPLLDSGRAEPLGRLFMALGAGLVQQIEQAVLAELSDNRQVQIMRFLHYNLHRAFTLAELAGEMHLSPSRTSHLVKQLFGVPFQELVIGQRMLRAMHFLRATDLPVAAVGRRVGIENEYHFNRLFKRVHGDPPARYRRQYQEGK